ncbi:MAG: BlaI/MecI/CopY family transcriptional regulator [Lachnospiraceae bacterium]|nr:BlaI/MecI/CopY family transcriptional regulator [Lachnospiraceae bacterium]
MDKTQVDLYHMGAVESKFAEIIWDREPISSGELVKLAKDRLEWKKSTTYTVLHKLCDKGIFKNESSVVTSVLNREQYYGRQSKQFVSETFSGSLPRFIAAFAGEEKLTKKEIASLKALLEEYEKEG